MKTVSITGEQQCAIVDQPDPVVQDNYVTVKILAAPMCTEVYAYRTGNTTDALGHEAAGEVVDVGSRARARIGDRVVVMPQNSCGVCDLCLSGEHIRCQTPRDPFAVTGSATGRSTYAQYCIQQDWLLYPVPDDISIEHGSMACCGLGPTFNAVEMMGVGAFDTVLISGLGAVGLGGVINAKLRGARVIALDSNPWRSALAKELGAELVINPADPDALEQIWSVTGGGADMAIEASSAEGAPNLLVQGTRINGQMTSVGWGGPMYARDIVARGITVRGAWHWNHLRDAKRMRQTLRAAAPQLDLLISHRMPMSQVQEAWELQIKGECAKIVLDPWK